MRDKPHYAQLLIPLAFAGALIASCTQHEVKLQAPDKPIEINLNVNIDHRVKVEIDKDLDKAMNNSNIF